MTCISSLIIFIALDDTLETVSHVQRDEKRFRLSLKNNLNPKKRDVSIKILYGNVLENPQEEYGIEVVTDSILLKQESLLKRIKEIDHVLV